MNKNSSAMRSAHTMLHDATVVGDIKIIQDLTATSGDARPMSVILSGPAGTISLNAEPTIQAGMRRRFEWMSSGTVALID